MKNSELGFHRVQHEVVPSCSRPIFCALGVAASVFLSVGGMNAQVVTFDTSGTTAATSMAATFNATQQAGGVSGIPQLSRTTLTATSGAAGSFFSNAGGNTGALDLTKDYVGFTVTPSAGNVLFATGINFTSQGSNTAPNSYAIAYSTDGFATSAQTTFTGTTVTTTVARAFDITDLITNDTLTTRLYNYGATSINGGTSAATGSYRVITPTVTGSAVAAATGAIALAANTEIRDSGALQLDGVISGAGFSITKTGAGTLTLSNSGNTYSGGTIITAGTVAVNGPNRLGSAAGALTINNGTFQLTTINSINTGISSGRNIVLGNATSTIQIDAGPGYTATNLSVVSGTGTLNKTGTGTLELAGANTYSGGTVVKAGALVISNATGSSATGTGAVTVNSGGSLLGTGYISAGANALAINGTLSPGAGTGSAGTINLASTLATGGLTLGNTSTLAFDLTSIANKDLVALTATSVALGGTLSLVLPDTTSTGIDYTKTYALFTGVNGLTGAFASVLGYDTTDYTANFTLTGGEYDLSFSAITAVPEPATYLGGMLLVGACGWYRRRQLRGLVQQLCGGRTV